MAKGRFSFAGTGAPFAARDEKSAAKYCNFRAPVLY